MSDNELSRVGADLAVMRRAMGFHPYFGRGMLALGSLLVVAAAGALGTSLVGGPDWLQLVPLGAILVLGPVGLYARSRRAADVSPDLVTQVVLSVAVYCAVWTAACGYAWATLLGPALGPARVAGLHALGVALLVGFSAALVRAAVRRRDQRYCLGLAAATLLAGTLFPVIGRHAVLPSAHGVMAVGYAIAVGIHRAQVREAVASHAAD